LWTLETRGSLPACSNGARAVTYSPSHLLVQMCLFTGRIMQSKFCWMIGLKPVVVIPNHHSRNN
jgi:hypothetical protein